MGHETVLTGAELDQIYQKHHDEWGDPTIRVHAQDGWDYERAIEQAILTKQAEKAQPVAVIRVQKLNGKSVVSVHTLIPPEQFNNLPDGTELYSGSPIPSALLEAAEKALTTLENMTMPDHPTRNELRAAIEAHKKDQ